MFITKIRVWCEFGQIRLAVRTERVQTKLIYCLEYKFHIFGEWVVQVLHHRGLQGLLFN